MAEPLKNLINTALVRQAAVHLQRGLPGFDARHFEQLASTGLDALEMKARAMHICVALEATLPADFEAAVQALNEALAPAEAGAQTAQLSGMPDGLRGWFLWPVGEYIARHGQAHPELALRALHALTQRFTAEFALRPFIARHPALTFATLQQWVHDKSPHVRRLVSEGSRPRLPWGLQLKTLIADPSPTLPLLLALQDDTSEYVRRSVAHGGTSPKVFRSWQIELPAGTEVSLQKRHSVRPISTRRYHAGHHGVAVQINGRVVAESSFVLRLPRISDHG